MDVINQDRLTGRINKVICAQHKTRYAINRIIGIGWLTCRASVELIVSVKKINEIGPSLEKLSHDELREKTIDFKKTIKENRKELDEKIERLKEEVGPHL